jgi:hypothetical protein
MSSGPRVRDTLFILAAYTDLKIHLGAYGTLMNHEIKSGTMPPLRYFLRDPRLWILFFILAAYTHQEFKGRNRVISTEIQASLLRGVWPKVQSTVWEKGPNLNHRRRAHRVSLLADGRILVSGGLVGLGTVTRPNRYLSSSEVYDPQKGSWQIIPNATGRFRHTSTTLPSGEVMLIGGQNDEETLATTEIFDPNLNEFRPGVSLLLPRRLHTATVLNNGNVLVVGGYTGQAAYHYPYGARQLRQAEEIDPRGVQKTKMTTLRRPRELHTATRLQDGRVLVTGGVWGEDTLRECEMYDPKQQTWKPVSPMQFPRTRHTATLLPDGRVLVIGGSVGKAVDQLAGVPQKNIYASCEIYDPKTDRWTLTDSMNYPRTYFMDAVLLPNGRILVGGGFGSVGDESNFSWELYDIATGRWILVGFWSEPIHAHKLVYAPQSNRIYRIGGLSKTFSMPTTEIWDLTRESIDDLPKVEWIASRTHPRSLTQVQITSNFTGGLATIEPRVGPVLSGQVSTVTIDRTTLFTFRHTKGSFIFTKRFEVQPIPLP